MEPNSNGYIRWISIIVGLIVLMLGWGFSYLLHIDSTLDNKADKTDASDRWTGSQQKEYRENIDNQIETIKKEVNRLRGDK